MRHYIFAISVWSMFDSTPLRAGPEPAFPLTASLAPTFAGFVGEKAVLDLVLHNPSSRDVTFAWKRLDSFIALDVRDRRGAQVHCRPTAASRRTRTPAWFVYANRDLVIAIDLLERCRFPGEGDYVITASFTAPDGTAGARRGSTNTASTTLVLGGRNGSGPATTPTLPALCRREQAETSRSGCFWTRGAATRCSGVDRAEVEMRFPDAADVPDWSCVCNGCIRDADCTAKPSGKCAAFPGDTCQPASHACVYPGDLCYSPQQCRNAACLADHRGGVSCRAPAPPPS